MSGPEDERSGEGWASGPPMPGGVRAVQQRVMANKVAKGFNTTDVTLELCLLQGEIAEFFGAWRRGQPHAAQELADVAIYVMGLAGIAGVDLEAEIDAKMRVNERRRYQRQHGVMTRLPASPDTCAGRDAICERDGGWER